MVRRPTRQCLRVIFVLVGLQLIATPSTALAQTQQQAIPADFNEITPEMRRAFDEGLAYLASIQQPDGSYGGDQYPKHVGITGIVCMAFMADGHLPGRGEHGEVVQRGLDFVLSRATASGLIAADTSHGPMYGHGYATLFLGEVYGQTQDPRVRDVLLKAVRLIVNTQNNEGGWRYQPVPFDADISLTITEIMALRSARNAGIHVPEATINNAISYVQRCQNPADGGFRYMLNSGGSAFPRSAAGVASLYYAGVYEGQAIEDGLEYLNRVGLSGARSGHYYYGHYYAVQAMFLAGGENWTSWYPQVRDELIDRQSPTGHWDSNHGNAYGTGMALLVLAVPNRLLPIYQR